MKKSTTKRALFLSFVSMFLCFTMLLGTTYAWFTDSVTSGVNTIVAGNLDVELYNAIGVDENAKVGETTKLFDKIELWEPGAAVYENFTVANKGNLALKYKFEVEISKVDGFESFADVLKVGVVAGGIAKDTSREDSIAKVTEWMPFESFYKSGTIEANANPDTYGVVVWWQPSDKDNDYNMNKGETQLKVNIGVNLFATQMEAESDSFGSDYDAGAPWTGGQDISWYDPAATEYVLDSAEDLAGLAAIVNGTAESPVTTFAASGNATVHDDFAGKTVKLDGDINLKGIEWTPIGRIGATSTDFTYSFKGTFDGNGHTIYNLKVSNEGWAGLFGIAHSATIKDLNVVGVEIESNRMTGAIVGQLYGSIDNCHVKDAKITVVPNVKGDSFDNGDKVGGIVGSLGDNGNNRTLTGCSAEDVTIKAYRDVGGIAGYVASSTTVDGNSVKSVNITADQITNHYGEKDINAGLIYGRAGGTITVGTNTEDENSSITEKYLMDGLKIAGDGKGAVVLAGVPEDYDSDTLNVPAGVTALGNKILVGNTTIKEVTVPSSVTGFGGTPNATGTGASGGMFYQSAVEKVVLPEGLTEIPVATFNQAANLKEVNIPSTVTKIGINAFAGSGLETLTITDKVTEIGYGAFRDMDSLTSVTIEGNVYIPDFAFRDCSNLKSVYLKGEDVTFGTNMIFTVTSTNNENPNGITVYVANETVKDRLVATGQFKGTIVVGATYTSSEEDISDALASGENVVLIKDVEAVGQVITTNGITEAYGNKVGFAQYGGVLDGGGNKMEGDSYGTYLVVTHGGTIKNLTMDIGERGIAIYSPTEDVIIDNVNICGDVAYAINTLEHPAVDGIDMIVTNSKLGGWMSFAGVDTASFTNCEFDYGIYYSNYPYNSLVKPYVTTTFTDCDFAGGYYIDLSALEDGCTVTLKNCTVDGVKITAENFAQYLVAESDYVKGETKLVVELRDGTYMTDANLVNYIVFK